jgi:hypothetical protein
VIFHSGQDFSTHDLHACCTLQNFRHARDSFAANTRADTNYTTRTHSFHIQFGDTTLFITSNTWLASVHSGSFHLQQRTFSFTYFRTTRLDSGHAIQNLSRRHQIKFNKIRIVGLVPLVDTEKRAVHEKTVVKCLNGAAHDFGGSGQNLFANQTCFYFCKTNSCQQTFVSLHGKLFRLDRQDSFDD